MAAPSLPSPDGAPGAAGQRDAPLLDLPMLRRLCPDARELRRLLDLALEHLQIDWRLASQALADDDPSRFRQCVHRLKGAVCLLCAEHSPILECFERVRLAQAHGDSRQMRHESLALERQLRGLQRELQAALRDMAA